MKIVFKTLDLDWYILPEDKEDRFDYLVEKLDSFHSEKVTGGIYNKIHEEFDTYKVNNIHDYIYDITNVCYRNIHKKIKKAEANDVTIVKERPQLAMKGLPNCVLVDIDDTIALRNKRKVFSHHKMGQDNTYEPMLQFIDSIDAKVIFLTGRGEIARETTLKWLQEEAGFSGITSEDLIMRAKGDFRPSEATKLDLYEQHIKGKYDVLAIFDDDERVVDAFRELGICSLQVWR